MQPSTKQKQNGNDIISKMNGENETGSENDDGENRNDSENNGNDSIQHLVTLYNNVEDIDHEDEISIKNQEVSNSIHPLKTLWKI